MDYLTSWIGEIILLILMAVVLELLLPNSSMQRYVRMVVGLLLLLALLKPVLSIFDVNPDVIFQKFSSSSTVDDGEIKNSIENQKRDIQASHIAYIEKKMGADFKKQVKKEVSDQFHLTVANIGVKLDQTDADESKPKVEQIDVYLKEQSDDGTDTVKGVKPVKIDVSKQQPVEKKEEDGKQKKIRSYFEKKWDLPPNKLTITLEGGDVTDDE